MAQIEKEYFMGSTPAQMKYTKPIEDTFERVSIICKYHDIGYKKSMSQPNLIMVLISKYLNDIEFLLNGIYYNLFQKNIFKGVGGTIVIIISFICIILYTPFYIKNHYKLKKVI